MFQAIGSFDGSACVGQRKALQSLRNASKLVPPPISHRAMPWRRLVAALLVGAMGLQVAPMASILQAPTPSRHHAADAFCPRNPDGPCVCDHAQHPSKAPGEGPFFRACGGATDHVASLGNNSVKGLIVAPKQVPAVPRIARWHHATAPLRPQHVADDIFRPPKPHVG